MASLKPYKDFPEQVQLLKDKGFVIPDDDACIEFLRTVSYYRLSAYYLPFRKYDGTYFENITFDRIREIYNFDQELRPLIFSTIETVEIFLRDRISHFYAEKYGSEGYMDSANYRIGHDHKDFQERIRSCIKENNTSLIVKHHKKHYGNRFPLWVIIEFFSIGFLSHFYLDFTTQDKKSISSALYGVSPSVLEGWLRCLTDLRNKCAHYSRVYYWIFTALPTFPDASKSPSLPPGSRPINTRRLFYQLYLLKLMYPLPDVWNENFVFPLQKLMEKYGKSISLIHIGFPPDWKKQLEWGM